MTQSALLNQVRHTASPNFKVYAGMLKLMTKGKGIGENTNPGEKPGKVPSAIRPPLHNGIDSIMKNICALNRLLV
jgi:hypothetical protein